jgi:hypothetical protein
VSNPAWEEFLEAVPWFLQDDQVAEVGVSAPPGTWSPAAPEFSLLFPELEGLLQEAVVTPLALSGTRYQLYSWVRAEGDSCAWLSPLPAPEPSTPLHPHHRILLSSFGGIVERSNDPSWWLLNHNEVLTEQEARHDGSFIRDYDWAFSGAEIPIELEQHYSIAREANGNTTVCHRVSGEVFLFAPDHSFDYVETLPGCPEYTLYRLRAARIFQEWVNIIARQWYEGL